MSHPIEPRDAFTDADREALSPDAKVGLLATVDPGERPHISLITSLAVKSPDRLMFGQFCEGASKDNLRRDPRAAFLVMTLDRRLWTGRARWLEERRDGEDHVAYNQRPMFRYNAYLGIHTVHYLALESVTGPFPLPLARLATGTLASQVGRALPARRRPDAAPVLDTWSRRFLARPSTLLFLSWIDNHGAPRLQAAATGYPTASDTLRLVQAGSTRAAPAAGAEVAVFAMSLAMESLLVRGQFAGYTGPGPLQTGALRLDWAYNPMPPKAGPVYPRPALRPAL